MKTDMGRVADAHGLLGYVTGRLNSEHGGRFGYSAQIGGDPSLVAVTGYWENIGAYQSARESMAGDAELQSAIRMASGLFTDVQDVLGQVLMSPGERQQYVETTGVRIHMPAAQEAVAFAVEVAEFVQKRLDRPIGLISAYTGDRSRLMFMVQGSSLQDLADADAEMEADTEYQGFYKRSEGLMVPGSLERSFWQILG